jgi:Zn-dependent M28 family amino/carboxypeptidase
MDWIGETFTSDVGWDHLERLVDVGNRMAGSPGEHEALAATRDALSGVGARNAVVDDFEIRGWIRGTSTLETADGEAECIALPRSPPGTVEAPLVDCGDGLPDDFADADLDGAVALVSTTVPDYYDRFVHRREKYYRAVEAGAVGFVFRNHTPGCLAPTGSVGTDADPLGPVPAVGVGREVGARLARRHAGTPVSLGVDCETPRATSGVVRADIGPDTDRAVYLTSHVDAHDIAEGAVDNAAGTATVLEVVRALRGRGDLDRRVRIVCFGAEEVGLRGSKREADLVDPDAVQAVVNCDGVCRGRTLQCYTHGFDDLTAAVERMADRFGHPVTVRPTQHPHSDHWPFVVRGVPAVLASSDDGDRGRGWGHTRADTLDKLEGRTLREGAILLTALVADLAATDRIGRRDPDAVAADLEAQDLAPGMRVTGDWPFATEGTF